MKKRMEAYFSGMVQGVGFRFTVDKIARDYEVGGFVRNLPGGQVELVAEGEEEILQEFLAVIRESQMQPYIQDLQVSWKPTENNFQSFTIRA